MILEKSRDEAFELLQKHLTNSRLIAHSIASEAVMKSLAREKNQNEEYWGMLGLLHDLDLSIVGTDMTKHGVETGKILRELNYPDEFVKIIQSHNDVLGLVRSSDVEYLLAAGETVTGLIVACALVLPDKKLASVTLDSLVRRFKEKAFAKGASRDNIKECEKAGISLERFLEITLNAMKENAESLGL